MSTVKKVGDITINVNGFNTPVGVAFYHPAKDGKKAYISVKLNPSVLNDSIVIASPSVKGEYGNEKRTNGFMYLTEGTELNFEDHESSDENYDDDGLG